MAAEGFVNLAEERWHYRLEPEPAPDTCYEVPVADWRDRGRTPSASVSRGSIDSAVVLTRGTKWSPADTSRRRRRKRYSA